MGKVINKDKNPGCKELSIEISGFASGLYFIRLSDDSGRVIGKGKFVKE